MRQQHASASYKHINALSRGLEVLRVLNQSQDSLSNPSAISKKLGLNRTTVRRILEEAYPADSGRSIGSRSFRSAA
jgi:hypothetical protein